MKTLLFIIDMQNDFCNPSGALYVPQAEKDAERLAAFIRSSSGNIDDIILTQDNHQVMDIAHSCFWVDKVGNNPAPYTTITYDDVQQGKWIPVIYKKEAVEYLKKVSRSGEYLHTIWPEHCIWGSEGAAIYPVLMDEVKSWARRHGKMYEVVSKGTNPLTEHFGAFRANVPLPDAPETQFNNSLEQRMQSYDKIYIAGEAKSHCVANTLKQLFDFENLFPKMVILEDCMSNVTGFDTLANPIYEKARKLGAEFTTCHLYTKTLNRKEIF